MSNKHRRGSVTNNFCSVAGTPCSCKNDYVKSCEGEASDWGEGYPQKYSDKNPATKLIQSLRNNQQSFQAHHVLPVACISEVIQTWDEEANPSPSVISGTKWCINLAKNMIAMPMWGHTIMWYTDNFKEVSEEIENAFKSENEKSIGKKKSLPLSKKVKNQLSDVLEVVLINRDTAPPFKDLPQHNYSHTGKSAATGYNQEIIEKLETIVVNIGDAKDKHDTPTINSIKASLDELSEDMKDTLKERGTSRVYNSTHEAWKGALKGKEDLDSDNWYQNFSMADEPPKMTFPLGDRNGAMAKKIANLARAMWMD
jgi:hypothetical protein